jgi:hypothetical protein
VKTLLESGAMPSTPSGFHKSLPQHAVVQCFKEFVARAHCPDASPLLARLQSILRLLQKYHCYFQTKNLHGRSAYDELMDLPQSEARERLEAILRPFEPSFQVRTSPIAQRLCDAKPRLITSCVPTYSTHAQVGPELYALTT